MKILTKCLVVTLASCLTLSGSTYAAPGKPKPPTVKPARVRAELKVDAALTDLATAKGSFDFQRTKKHSSLKGLVRLPVATTSLGVSDAATAATAKIHLEFARAGQVFADCTLVYQAGKADITPSQWQYRLHVKSNGKKDVNGTCGVGDVPALEASDAVTAYADVAGTRVPFMTK
jgi:hypothetical protein